jgi:hypothetical protein
MQDPQVRHLAWYCMAVVLPVWLYAGWNLLQSIRHPEEEAEHDHSRHSH